MTTRRIRPSEDRAAALWADMKRASGWTTQRQVQLDAWLKDRPDRQALLRRHEALIDDPALVRAGRDLRQARNTRQARREAWFKQPRLVAAMGAGLATAAVTIIIGVNMLPRGERLVGTPGTPAPVVLADGSEVRLNGLSEVRVELGRQERLLHLKGEGFFEVASDKARPFSVDVDGVRVTAVGTRFNVDQRKSAGGDAVEVVVFEGVVDVTSDRGMSMRVRAGQKAIVSGGVVERASLIRPEASTDIPSWAKGWLEFNEASLGRVAEDLERASGVQVDLKGAAVRRIQVSGRFAYDQPENALEAIARLHGLTLTRKGPDRFEISEG